MQLELLKYMKVKRFCLICLSLGFLGGCYGRPDASPVILTSSDAWDLSEPKRDEERTQVFFHMRDAVLVESIPGERVLAVSLISRENPTRHDTIEKIFTPGSGIFRIELTLPNSIEPQTRVFYIDFEYRESYFKGAYMWNGPWGEGSWISVDRFGFFMAFGDCLNPQSRWRSQLATDTFDELRVAVFNSSGERVYDKYMVPEIHQNPDMPFNPKPKKELCESYRCYVVSGGDDRHFCSRANPL